MPRVLKIADFGLARSLSVTASKLSPEMITRWYRAPEVLMGQRDYTTAVDMWSIGCIMAEWCQGKALLQGKNEVDQLARIFQMVSPSTWPELSKQPRYAEYAPQLTEFLTTPHPDPFKLTLASITDDILAQDLLRNLLQLNPANRISVSAALAHPFFHRFVASSSTTVPRAIKKEEQEAKNAQGSDPVLLAQAKPPFAPRSSYRRLHSITTPVHHNSI